MLEGGCERCFQAFGASPKIVSCTVRNLGLGCFPRCETRFARCERLFWDSRPKDPKSLLAPSLKQFWAFWLLRHVYQASGVANLTCTPPQCLSLKKETVDMGFAESVYLNKTTAPSKTTEAVESMGTNGCWTSFYCAFCGKLIPSRVRYAILSGHAPNTEFRNYRFQRLIPIGGRSGK